MALRAKQAIFVDEYLIDLNATQAAIRAGYSAKTAEWTGPQLLKNSQVAAKIAEKMRIRGELMQITQERVLREFAKIAFFDPRKLFDGTGKLKPVAELDDDTAAMIASVDVVNIGTGENTIGEVIKVRLADKKGALDSLARHLGMFNDKLHVNVSDALAERLRRAKVRSCS